MKVLAVFRGTYPNGGPMSKRLHLYLKGLFERGNSINLIIPHSTEIYRVDRSRDFTCGVYEGVTFKYLSKSIYRSNSLFRRKLDDIVGYFRLLNFCLTQRTQYDIMLVVDVRNLFIVPLYILSKILRKPMVYELNEHPLIITSKIKYRIDKLLFYKCFDGFILISKSLEDLVKDIKSKNAKTVRIPIVSEQKLTQDVSNGQPPQYPYMLHSGSLHDSKDGIIGMILAFSIIHKRFPSLRFYLTGRLENSPDSNEILKLIDDHSLQNKVHFLGFVSEEELRSLQSNCSFTVINKSDNLQNNYCFPTKLGEFLSWGVPVIITQVGEVKNFMVDRFNCHFVKYGDPELIAERIIEIFNFPDQTNKIGENGRELAISVFDYKIQAQRLETFLLDLMLSDK